MSSPHDARWLAGRLNDRTARGIAVETSALIRSGALPIGTRLPTVRDLAFELGVSPATVSEAWSELRRQKMISGRGRTGIWVFGNTVAPQPARMASIGHFDDGVLDLTLAAPDRQLLPPLAQALTHGAHAENLNSYERTPILGELRAAVEERWPYRPETFLATNGGYNALYSALHALVMPGASVAIEDPTAMRILDIIEDLGAEIIPVACDSDGPLPDALAKALNRKPTVFIYQPRTHSVTGRAVSPARLGEIATVLDRSECFIMEDDGVGDVSPLAPVSLGGAFPERVIHILSFSKSLGPDLRLAVLSGSSAVIKQIQSYRSFSSGWTSRLLQAAAAWLLTDTDSIRIVAEARDAYAARREALACALRLRGIDLPSGDGLCVWIPVASEQFALITLAARGIAVLPGTKCSVNPTNHIRVATSMLVDRYDFVADSIALAAGSSG
ncbi:PLP-dependent aminotransferase family protein [Microvirga thermotolerans]|uniref:8-amino-7-oxononanoate synthase n=1 Tax=Microvirga thermotolerans TaxID=2651334 RepID=A0A5P9K0E0_9HYPH|nr:PLP-dependent aminotransferase family protein [Microvirga thermotolerans]QFU18183.1 aminotransferase class I/II-fold pyridoxal phosphate-dependent enzyme [Microvirga thermotolerans]